MSFKNVFSAGPKSSMDQIKGLGDGLLGRKPEEGSIAELQGELCAMCPKLSYTQRFWGFGICMGVGFMLSFGSVIRLGDLLVPSRTSLHPLLTRRAAGRVKSTVAARQALLSSAARRAGQAGNPIPFAAVYSIGNCCSLAGTAFLVGPCKQMRNMFAKTRVVATIVYILSIAATILVCVIPLHACRDPADPDPVQPLPSESEDCKKEKLLRVVLVLVAVSVQMVAFLWYCFSYIPYGRTVRAGPAPFAAPTADPCCGGAPHSKLSSAWARAGAERPRTAVPRRAQCLKNCAKKTCKKCAE
jgi:hypothetical protein